MRTGYFVPGLTGPPASENKMVSSIILLLSCSCPRRPRNRRRPRGGARTIPADCEWS